MHTRDGQRATGRERARARLTAADWVTLTRAFVGVIGGGTLVALSYVGVLPQRPWALFLLLVPTIALDAVDGAVARATDTATARGARWDMEADSAVLLVASLAVAPFAPWALMIGLARYLFGLGGLVRPVWSAPLPFLQSRRLIAGFQGFALVVALAPFVALWLAQLVTGVAVVLLVFSFGRDIVYLERRR